MHLIVVEQRDDHDSQHLLTVCVLSVYVYLKFYLNLLCKSGDSVFMSIFFSLCLLNIQCKLKKIFSCIGIQQEKTSATRKLTLLYCLRRHSIFFSSSQFSSVSSLWMWFVLSVLYLFTATVLHMERILSSHRLLLLFSHISTSFFSLSLTHMCS